MQVQLDVTILRLGSRFIATTELGGFRIRSAPSGTNVGAFRNLLWKLSGNGPADEDAELGVHMLLEGTDLHQEMARQALPPAKAAEEREAAAIDWMKAHPGKTYQDYLDEQERELWPNETPRAFRPSVPGGEF